ncbi:MAG: hypothetical protein H6917_10395 [Novosphingobium sp.]|nr:hypothetical protein [Novosphingobium sp.]MCP5402781.1 hypothetical protein [Novosphingobium sp.]
MTNAALSLMVLTAIALVAGAFWLRRRGGSRRQVVLMLVLAAVVAVNVAIWTLPDSSGEAPVDRLPE